MAETSLRVSTTCTLMEEDIDCYGHITNSLIPYYFDIARVNAQKAAGLSDSGLKARGIGLLVVAAEYTYREQLFPRQVVRIDSELSNKRGCVIINHSMCLEDRIVATAQTKHLFVDLLTKKVARSRGRIYAKHPYH